MTDKEIDKLAEEKFGFNSATESYKAWVEGFRAGFDTAQSFQKNELVIPDVVGRSEQLVCDCPIPNATMELPHRCIKCDKPIKWD